MVQRTAVLALTCLAGLSFTPEARAGNTDLFQPLATVVEPLLLSSSSTQPDSAQARSIQGEAWLVAQATAPETTSEPPSTPSASNSPILLNPGTASDDVKVLQRQLQDLGYYAGPIDGQYGLGTQQSIRTFQQSQNLPTTGVLDQNTWDQMTTPELFSKPSGATSTTGNTPEGTVGDPLPSPSSAGDNPADANADPSGKTDEATPMGTLAPTSPAATASEPANEGEGAGTAGDAAAQTANPEGTTQEQPSPDAQNQRSRPRGLLFLALLLLIGLPITLIAAFLLWRRLRSDADAASESPETQLYNAPTGQPPASPTTTGFRNGAMSTPSQTAGAGDTGSAHQFSGDTNSAADRTTRLARIDILDELISDLEKPDPEIRHKAIWELGQRGNSNAVQPLVSAMIDADSKERSLILAALSEIGTRTMKPMQQALAMSLQDQNPEVRKNAIRDLMRVYDLMTQMSQLLGHAAQDQHPEVQQTAQWAMERLSHLRQLPPPKPSSSISSGISTTDFLTEDTSSFAPRRMPD
jgi:peptidoglycan hydrolase-like protein with peptidoglycan-binding domain